MISIYFISTIAVALYGILSVILFFKIWRSCNDIKRLADTLAPIQKDAEIQSGDIVKYNTSSIIVMVVLALILIIGAYLILV